MLAKLEMAILLLPFLFIIDLEPTFDPRGDVSMFFVIRLSDKNKYPTDTKEHVDYILKQRSVNLMTFEF